MNFNSLIPELTVSDIKATKDFYVNILGFKIEYERPENNFAFLSLEGNQIMFDQENGNWDVGVLEYPFGRGVNFEMTVSNVDKLYAKIIDKGVIPFQTIKESSYRSNDKYIVQKEFLVQDPDGYLLRFTDQNTVSQIRVCVYKCILVRVVLKIFEIGEGCDETTFYFKTDPKEKEHYLGYKPEYKKPYWVGYCDIENGCEFLTAKEMFEAPIYDGKSIKDRWNEIVLCTIGGCPVEWR